MTYGHQAPRFGHGTDSRRCVCVCSFSVDGCSFVVIVFIASKDWIVLNRVEVLPQFCFLNSLDGLDAAKVEFRVDIFVNKVLVNIIMKL